MKHLSLQAQIIRPIVLFLALGMVAVACGGGDSDEPASGSQSIEAEVVATQSGPATPTAPDVPVSTPAPNAEPTMAEIPSPEPEPTATPGPANQPESTAPQAPTSEPEPVSEPENPAPELGTIDSWHNSSSMTLAELRGTPVLLVFWADF